MGAVLNKDIFWTTLNFLMPFISRRVQKLTIEYFTLACLGWTCQGLKFLCVGVNTGIIIFLQQTANQFVDEENGNFIDNAIYAFILGSTIAITSLACVPLLDIAVGVIVSHILNQLRLQAKVEGQSFAYNIVFTFRKMFHEMVNTVRNWFDRPPRKDIVSHTMWLNFAKLFWF